MEQIGQRVKCNAFCEDDAYITARGGGSDRYNLSTKIGKVYLLG